MVGEVHGVMGIWGKGGGWVGVGERREVCVGGRYVDGREVCGRGEVYQLERWWG